MRISDWSSDVCSSDLMLKTEANPGGLPIDVFDGIRKGTFDNRPQFFPDLTLPFYGYNRDGAGVWEAVRDEFVRQDMTGRLKGLLDRLRAFSASDLHEDLQKFAHPPLFLASDDDQALPIGIRAPST